MEIKVPELGKGPKPLVDSGGVSFATSDVEFDKAIKNIKQIGPIVTYYAARAVAEGLAYIMGYVQPIVPYFPGGYVDGKLQKPSTGKLRESGTARIYLGDMNKTNYITIATGNKDGSVSVNLSKMIPSRFADRNYKTVSGDISYQRISEETGLDIALWTHEALQPYEDRFKGIRSGWYARSPGTGPKYLELPWLQHKAEVVSYIRNSIKAVEKDIAKGIKVKKQSKTHYEVDTVDIRFEDVRSKGHWGGLTAEV